MWKRPRLLYVRAVRFSSAHLTQNSRGSSSLRIKCDELEIPVKMVLTSLKQLDINKSTGSDGISVRLLKKTADQIAPFLTMLFNKSCGSVFFWETGNSRILYPFSKKERETLRRIIALFPFFLSYPKFPSAAFWRVYGIIYLTLSVANSMAF